MATTQRIGQAMRAILVVLNANRTVDLTTAELAKRSDISKSSVRHSVALLAAGGLVADRGMDTRRAWFITVKGLDVLNDLWAKEGGAAVS